MGPLRGDHVVETEFVGQRSDQDGGRGGGEHELHAGCTKLVQQKGCVARHGVGHLERSVFGRTLDCADRPALRSSHELTGGRHAQPGLSELFVQHREQLGARNLVGRTDTFGFEVFRERAAGSFGQQRAIKIEERCTCHESITAHL